MNELEALQAMKEGKQVFNKHYEIIYRMQDKNIFGKNKSGFIWKVSKCFINDIKQGLFGDCWEIYEEEKEGKKIIYPLKSEDPVTTLYERLDKLEEKLEKLEKPFKPFDPTGIEGLAGIVITTDGKIIKFNNSEK